LSPFQVFIECARCRNGYVRRFPDVGASQSENAVRAGRSPDPIAILIYALLRRKQELFSNGGIPSDEDKREKNDKHRRKMEQQALRRNVKDDVIFYGVENASSKLSAKTTFALMLFIVESSSVPINFTRRCKVWTSLLSDRHLLRYDSL
jgi:hypothetical protein